MGLIPLQSIADSCYFNGSAMTCLLDQLVAAFGGGGLFGALAGGVLFIVMYVAGDGGMATPTVAVILTGTVFIGMVPAGYQDLAMGVVVIGLTAAIWQVVQKYVLQGMGAQ